MLEKLTIPRSSFFMWRGEEGSSKPPPRRYSIPLETIRWAVAAIMLYPSLGGRKLSALLVRHRLCYISPRSLDKIKKQAGAVLLLRALLLRTVFDLGQGDGENLPVRYEFSRPLVCWCMDFTYLIFKKGIVFLSVVLDDCSRKVLAFTVSYVADVWLVLCCYLEAVSRWGKPLILKRDNGAQYKSYLFREVMSRLEQAELPSPPYYAQYNGKVEASIKTIKKLIYERVTHPDPEVEEVNRVAEEVIYEYNEILPHQELGYVTPEDRFVGRQGKVKDSMRRFKREELSKRCRYSTQDIGDFPPVSRYVVECITSNPLKECLNLPKVSDFKGPI